jgi:tripartite ATP-independent transporter DctP family solute receptor
MAMKRHGGTPREDIMTDDTHHHPRGPSRRTVLALGGAVAGAAALGVSMPAIGQTSRTIRFGSPQPASSLYNQAIVRFADEVGKLSSGRIKVQVFPGSELGGVAEMLSSVRAGSLGMTIAVPAWYSNFVKPMDVFTLPYLVDSAAKLKAGLDGAVGEKITALAKPAGFQIVGYWLMGGRHIVNKVRPVNKPADLAGLKLRVINSQVYLQAFRALGANPVALDPAELYLALQQGVVDGFAYPLPDILDAKLNEVAGYVSLDAHVTDFFIVSMNPALWDGLAADEQAMVKAAMKTAMDWQWAEQPKAIDKALATLREKVKVNDIAPADRKLLIEATRPIYKNFEGSIGADLLALAQKELGSA